MEYRVILTVNGHYHGHDILYVTPTPGEMYEIDGDDYVVASVTQGVVDLRPAVHADYAGRVTYLESHKEE